MKIVVAPGGVSLVFPLIPHPDFSPPYFPMNEVIVQESELQQGYRNTYKKAVML